MLAAAVPTRGAACLDVRVGSTSPASHAATPRRSRSQPRPGACTPSGSQASRLLPQTNDEPVLLLDQVGFGPVIGSHGPDNPIADSHTQMLDVAIVAEDLLQ